MIPYIQDRLFDWAEWSRMRIDGFYGLGGGGFGYDEPMPSHQAGYAAFGGPWQVRCIETDEGVAWLKLDEPQVGACVVVHYRDHPNWSAAMQCELLHISLRTYWRRLETAHALLLGYFIDRAVGIVPQTEELRQGRRVLVLKADA